MTSDALSDLAVTLKNTDKADTKTRRKIGRRLGHMAMQLEQAGQLSRVEDIDLALKALALGAGAHSYPQRYHMSRARLLQHRRDILGLPEPVIAFECAKTLDVEAGALFVADAQMPPDQFVTSEPFHVTMNRLRFFSVGLGGDGVIKMRLRIHESGPCEPQSSEFRRLREATPMGRVNCPSGHVRVTGGGAKNVSLAVSAHKYIAAAYGLGIGRTPECLILLSPLVGEPPLDLVYAPELLM